ncbi:MAG: BON domain-containing protein [Hyphomicrobiales bacterium]|nr:BON domain-containing protein [Hyphomicrobiales bacterium]
MSDGYLRQLVLDELDFEPSVDAVNIGVAVEKGVVTLSGHVASYAEKTAAEQAAQRVKGVRGIAEEIEVRYAHDKKTADDQIVQRALSIISWDARIPSGSVHVVVQQGWVTLSGAVEWFYQKRAAEAAVRKLSGVVGVSNKIEVTPRVQASDVKTKIVAALERNADIEANAIKVAVEGGGVKLEGRVKAWYERNLAERAAWSVPGVRDVDDRLTLA